jgi:hypothetical protein
MKTTNVQVRGGFGRRMRYNVRAQNGPGIAVVEHRPGPDLSASLDYTEEH